MKSSVAIALIVCGTVLVAVPYINYTLGMRQVADVMVALDKTVNITGNLPKHADSACMVGGFIMVLVGAVFGLRTAKAG